MASKLTLVNCSKCKKCIYENSNSICCDDCDNWFHLRCSKMRLIDFKKFAKDPSLKFYCHYCSECKCGKCCRPVFDHQNGIMCDACDSWFHLRCSKLNLEQYHNLSNSNIDWICSLCYKPPFSDVDNAIFLETFNNFNKLEDYCVASLNNANQLSYSPKCNVCNRKTINANTLKKLIPCSSCFSLIHRKCSNFSLGDLLGLDTNNLVNWECDTCISNKFPFSHVSETDLVSMSFNSNFSCKCLEKESHSNSFSYEKFIYAKYLNDNEDSIFGPDPHDNLDKIFDLDPKFDYFDNHDFHKLCHKQTKNNNSDFSLFHTNIQSLNHNFEQLEILINQLEHEFDVIALSETWNPDNKSNFVPGILDNYQNYSGTKGTTIKSGCGVYVKLGLKSVIRQDLNISFYDVNNEFQSHWIEIYNKKLPIS